MKRSTHFSNTRRSYRLHKGSIEKIMNKSSTEYIKRSSQLKDIKRRMNQSFSYTQNVKFKEIKHVNQLVYGKIHTPLKHTPIIPFFDQIQGQIEQQKNRQFKLIHNPEVHEKNQAQKIKHLLLRNHRQSPIHKSTMMERNRQNLRLALKLIKPVKSIDTKKLEELHRKTSEYKQRIMKYEESMLKTTRYLRKVSHSSSFISSHQSSSKSLRKNLNNLKILENVERESPKEELS